MYDRLLYIYNSVSVAYTKTLSEGENLKVVSTEDVLTRVIVTESNSSPSTVFLASTVAPIAPTPALARLPVTTDVTKTYFVTYTYFKTVLESGQTTVKSEVATSSDVFTEKYTINPKRTQVMSSTDVSMNLATDVESSANVVATKTYLTTFTYFTTLLQDNSSPSIVVKSRTKVVENIVMETIDPGQINIEYQSLINKFRSEKPVEINEVRPIHITTTQDYSIKSTATADLLSSFEDAVASNIVSGSTVVSFEGSEEVSTESSARATPALITATESRPPYNHKPADSTTTADTQQINATKRPTSNKMESIIKIGSLGLNALGPMINAMAGLIKNNLKASKRNDTIEKIADNPDPPQALVKRPPPTLYSNSPSNSGINDDTDTAESQNFEGFNRFQDVQQRHKSPLSHRTSSGPQILGGGIPISPGQVITANSDVIIGKPAIHGPRPPPKKHYENDNVEGMVPPPPPPPPLAVPPSQISPTPSQHTPKWHLREQENYQVLPGNKLHLKNIGRLPPDREFTDGMTPDKISIKLSNPPKIHAGIKTHDVKSEHKPPPPEFMRVPYAPTYPSLIGGHIPLMHAGIDPLYQIPLPTHHEAPPIVKHGHLPFTTRLHYQHYGSNGFPYIKNLTHYNVHYQPPGKIPSDFSGDHTFITPPINHFIPNSTLGITDSNRPSDLAESLPFGNDIKKNIYNHKIKIPPFNRPNYDGSSSPPRPLLVNIQPSQVANVLIPHGSSIALIYNNRSENHAPKGQIINEPSAYPDVKVGMVAGLTNPNKQTHQSAHIPINAVKIDVPVSPQRTNPFNKLTTNVYYQEVPNNQHSYNNFQSYNQFNQQVTGFLEPNYYNNVDDDRFEDLEESDQIETEGGEVIQASNERPLRPGQLPQELLIKPTTPSRFGVDYMRNSSKTSEVNIYPEPTTVPYFIDHKMDLTYGKPKTTEAINQLFYTTRSPVISTKPLTTISAPPKHIKPTTLSTETLKVNLIKSTAPVISHGGFTAMISDKIEPKISQPSSPPTVKTFDDTIVTMNMDEKPPKPTYETPPTANFGKPMPVDLHMSSPRPFTTANKFPYDRHSIIQNEAVVGLSPPPPPPSTIKNPNESLSSKRPFGPVRKRPPPQYLLESISPTYDTKVSKIPDNNKPPPVPVPTEDLSPPKFTTPENYFDRKTTPTYKQTTTRYQLTTIKYPTSPRRNYTTLFSRPAVTTTTPASISPVLRGSFTVEEVPKRPEVSIPDTKPTAHNVITGKPMSKIENKTTNSYTINKGNTMPNLAPTKVSKFTPENTSNKNVITGSQTMFVEYEHSNAFGKNTATDLISSGATTIFYQTRPSRSSSHRIYASTIYRHSSKPESHKTMESLKPTVTTNVVTTTKTLKPTSISKVIVTHTKTLTVTTTESTVIKSEGMKPSTHTLIITKTLTSMILDTVTEVHTLIKPTNILSTVTTTIPQATTTHTVYPSQVAPTTTPPLTIPSEKPNHLTEVLQNEEDTDSILVIMTDKNTKNTLPQYSDEPPPEIEAEEEELEIGNNLLLAGLVPGSVESDCHPSCRASRNEVCQKIENIMRCVCRPGFARMFPDRPCKRKFFLFTYKLILLLHKTSLKVY